MPDTMALSTLRSGTGGLLRGCTGASQHVYAEGCAVRLADEGVPIGAIVRSLKVGGEQVREWLHDALYTARIIDIPKEDWPPGQTRAERAPTVAHHERGQDDHDVILRLARCFRTTPMESHVLLSLLRRRYCTREMLHDAVEDNRGNPAEPTGEKIVDVVIHKLRRKLTRHDIVITTVHSLGYEITFEDQAKMWAMVKERGDR